MQSSGQSWLRGWASGASQNLLLRLLRLVGVVESLNPPRLAQRPPNQAAMSNRKESLKRVEECLSKYVKTGKGKQLKLAAKALTCLKLTKSAKALTRQ